MCGSQPLDNPYRGWTGPRGSYNCKMPLNNNCQETLGGEGFLPTGPRNYTAHLGPHRGVTGRERPHGPGVLLFLELARVCGLTLYW